MNRRALIRSISLSAAGTAYTCAVLLLTGASSATQHGRPYPVAIAQYLQSAFPDTAIRLYYEKPCRREYGKYHVPDARAKIEIGAGSLTGFAAIQQMFRDDAEVRVTRDDAGVIRIYLGAVQTAILRTTIRHVALSPREQYAPALAIEAIEGSMEFESAMQRLRLHIPEEMVDNLFNGPEPYLPHLSSSLSGTVDEMLDTVSKTFKGVVSYGLCETPNGSGFVEIEWG